MTEVEVQKEVPKSNERELGKFVEELNKGKVSEETLGAMGDFLKRPEKLKDHKEVLKEPLKNFINNIPDSQNQLTKSQKEILEMYHKLYIGATIPSENLLKVVKDHIKTPQVLKGEQQNPSQETPESLITKINNPEFAREKDTNLEKLKNIKVTQEQVKTIIEGIEGIEGNIEIKQKIKNALIQSILTSGYTINSQADMDFIKNNGSEEIKKQIKDLKFDDKQEKKVLKIESGKVIFVNTKDTPTAGETSLSKITQDMAQNGVNEQNLQEFLDKLGKSGKIGEGLKKFFEAFFTLFKSLLGSKGGIMESEINNNDEKIETLTNMLKKNSSDQVEFFKDIFFNDKGEFEDINSEKNQGYIMTVQKLLGIEAETKEEGDKKIYVYGDKTKQAVKDIQVKIYGEDKAGQDQKITGKFDEQTVKDYLEFLKNGQSATSNEEVTDTSTTD
ncbi:hypothetical protein HGA92_02710 [Candidatus Gracilibacteria bacterium]|nr:hypothetical protein [Candidatus Gracilibacteria bacterium]NUJ98328.1 hypothetical protein [Candidatus Gracilibacteria bacterium]NUJ99317.1 hypothetical protein [Candidatus Gracilibacteria bacterium]